MIDDEECEAVGEMRIGRGNRSTRTKPALLPLCPPQIPFDLTWVRTRTAAVGRRRLNANVEGNKVSGALERPEIS
jgi:hypothetical protein